MPTQGLCRNPLCVRWAGQRVSACHNERCSNNPFLPIFSWRVYGQGWVGLHCWEAGQLGPAHSCRYSAASTTIEDAQGLEPLKPASPHQGTPVEEDTGLANPSLRVYEGG